MKILQCTLVMAMVLGAGAASGQESEKPKKGTVPWWMLEDSASGQSAAKANEGKDPPPAAEGWVDVAPSERGTPNLAPPRRPQRERGPALVVPANPARIEKPKPRERVVVRLANMPAVDIAETINRLMREELNASGEDARSKSTIVLAEPISNSIILSGTVEAVRQTVKLVEQLDAKPKMVSIHAVVALVEPSARLSLLAPQPDGPVLECSHEEACELIEEYGDSEGVKILARPQIMTLDNQPAYIQVGQRVPRVTMRNSKQGQVLATELENVGLIMGVTPRIAPDGTVTMEIDLEKSELGAESDGLPIGVDGEENVIRSPAIDVTMVQTTVKIAPGRTVLVGGLALKDGDEQGELVLAVTPHLVDGDE